jgi:hypothetical protein
MMDENDSARGAYSGHILDFDEPLTFGGGGDLSRYSAAQASDDAAAALRRISPATKPGDYVEQRIIRAAALLALPLRTVRRLWYRRVKLVPAYVATRIAAFDRRMDDELVAMRARLAALERDH